MYATGDKARDPLTSQRRPLDCLRCLPDRGMSMCVCVCVCACVCATPNGIYPRYQCMRPDGGQALCLSVKRVIVEAEGDKAMVRGGEDVCTRSRCREFSKLLAHTSLASTWCDISDSRIRALPSMPDLNANKPTSWASTRLLPVGMCLLAGFAQGSRAISSN